MLTPLLRHLRGLPLLLLALLIFGARPAQASHFLGGEMSYRYLGALGSGSTPFRYEITAVIYINDYQPENPAPANGSLDVFLYNKSQGNAFIRSLTLPRITLSNSIAPTPPGNCMLPSPPRPFRLAVYRQQVNLPVSFTGYYGVLAANARNVAIDNIVTAGNNTPMTLYLDMAPPLLQNSSPVFADTAVALICQGDTTIRLNSAIDPDGDRLVYTFGTPAQGTPGGGTFTPPPPPVPYYAGFSLTQPLGASGFASVNATTGLARYKSNIQGEFVVAIDVAEYRNINGQEVLLGTTRRDLQLVVRQCPANPSPQLPPVSGGGGGGGGGGTTPLPRNYTIEEGQSVTIPFSATDPNNDPLVLQLNSVLLDGTGATGFDAALNGNQGIVAPGNVTGTAQQTGTGSVAGSFVFNSRCGNARNTPYTISVTVQDRGCGGQTIADVFSIQVNRAAGPSGIAGPTVVCDPAVARTYTATGPVPASYNWRVVGGTITAGQGSSAVTVLWNSLPTTGTLVLKGISAFGCPTDSVTTNVDVRPLGALTVTPTSPVICRGASTTLSVSGPAGLSYTWTGGPTPLTGSSVTVSPLVNTTYTVTGTDGTCSTSQLVTVSVTPPPTADAGPNRSFCSGQSAQIGTTPVAGNTYSWSPTTGLSNPNIANPTVTLTNTTSAPITTTYTLTVTTANSCVNTGTVQVTVTPGATANAGPAVSFCSGLSAQLGTPALAGTTYLWSPSTGLSDPTAAQPTLTLTNTTGAPITTTYTVTATTANSCTATSTVQVTVNPAAVVVTGPDRRICSGGSVQLGAPAVPGNTYSWSPATGLSDPSSSTPTVTLNTTGAPLTITYTLTVTTTNGCVSTGTVAVTANPLPIANAGPNRATCSGVASAPLGAPAVPGYTYTWFPITGLSDPAAAQPTVTLTNTTGAPITQVYTVNVVTGLNPTCTAQSTVTVTINPAAVATPVPTLAFCSGTTATLSGTTPVAGTTYLWSPATGLSDPTAANPTITATNTTGAPIITTYTLTATTANGCVASASTTVTVNPAAVATPGPNLTVCSGVSAQLGTTLVTGTTYLWSPATGLSDPTAANPTVTLTNTTGAPTSTTYTLTATTANGCVASASTTVTVNPAAVASPGPAVSFCSGGSAQLGTAPVAGTTYLWSPATGLSDPTAANPTVSGTNTTGAPIATTYTLTATTANNCVATATVLVTINQAAIANAGNDQSQCVGFSGQLGVLPVAGTSYLWSPATGLSSATVANPTLTLTNTTGSTQVFTYTLTATTAEGCVATDAMTLTLFPAAVATPGPAVAFCSGGSAQLGTAPIAGTTYLWSPATGLSSATVANPTVTLTNITGAPITTTYTLTATTANNCVASATVLVTVNQAAQALPGGNRSVCSGLGTALGAAPVAGNTYLWSPATGLDNPTAANPTATLTNPGPGNFSQTYTLTTTTAQGCSATGSVTVTVFPAPIVNAGPDLVLCSGQSAVLGTPAIPGYTYVWTADPFLSSSTVAQPTYSPINTGGAPFFRILVLTVTTPDGCVATAQVRVDVNQAAVANAGPAISFCGGESGQLGVAPIAGTTYSWTPTAGLSDPTASNPTIVLPNTTGAPITTTYTLTATTAEGCTATGTVQVTVNQEAVANVGTPGNTCSGGTVQLGVAPIAGTTYSWSPATDLSNPNISNPTATLTNTTGSTITAIYTLTATTAQGCVTTRGIRIDVFPAAIATASPSGPQTICSGETTQLGIAPVAGTTYLWSPTTGLSDPTAANPTVTLTNTTSAPITTTYTLTATTADNCVATGTVTVTVNPAPIVDAGADRTVCADERPVLGTAAQPAYTYAWTPATGLSSTSAAQPVVNTTGLNPGTTPLTIKYYLTGTTPQGCALRDSVQLTINPRPTAEGIFGSASVCPTVTGVAYSVVNPTGTAYQWRVTGGTIASGQGTPAITVDWGTAGNGSVQLFRFNSFGCSSDTTTLPVRINLQLITPTPDGPGNVLAAAPNNSVCQNGGPYVYATTPYTNGSSYSWAITGGTQVSSNLNTVTVQWDPVLVPTIREIVVTETSDPAGGRCLGTSAALRVLVNPAPLGTLALTGPSRVCQGSPISFTLPGGFAGSTYQFLLGTTPVAGTGNSVSLPAQTVPGTYVLSVRETSAQGCAGPLYTTTFTVDPTPAVATITGSRFVCDINQTQQYSVPNTAGSTYAWTVTGGTITAGQNSSQVTVSFTPGQTSYQLSVVETSAFGCAGPVATATVLPDNPSVTLAVASVDVASNNRVILTIAAPGSINNPNQIRVLRREAGVGAFAVVGTVAPSATSFTDATADAANKSYEYQLELTNGCGTVLQSVLTRTVQLRATATPGTGGRNQGSVTLNWNAYVGFPVQGYQIYRRDDNGTAVLVRTVSGTTLSADLANLSTGFNQCFRVVAFGAAGQLSNSNLTCVDFANPVAFYNVITPNGDGQNDVLVIDNIQLYPGNTLTIFNRWGREVYNTTNYQSNWGGADNAAGVYYYLLKMPNGSSSKGWFEIIK